MSMLFPTHPSHAYKCRSVRRHAAYVAHFSQQTALKRIEEEKLNLFKARQKKVFSSVANEPLLLLSKIIIGQAYATISRSACATFHSGGK